VTAKVLIALRISQSELKDFAVNRCAIWPTPGSTEIRNLSKVVRSLAEIEISICISISSFGLTFCCESSLEIFASLMLSNLKVR
jgi:hypothetical protein